MFEFEPNFFISYIQILRHLCVSRGVSPYNRKSRSTSTEKEKYRRRRDELKAQRKEKKSRRTEEEEDERRARYGKSRLTSFFTTKSYFIKCFD